MGAGNLYCQIYLDCEKSQEELQKLVAHLVDGVPGRWKKEVKTTFGDVSLISNDDYKTPKEKRSKLLEDAFLYWRYYLEIEPLPAISRETYVKKISRVLRGLGRLGIGAVAACDFEEELPGAEKRNSDRPDGTARAASSAGQL